MMPDGLRETRNTAWHSTHAGRSERWWNHVMSRRISPTLPVRRLTARATLRGDFALVAPRGELDGGTAVGALSQLHAVLDAGGREVLVDLSEITAINEAGIATLHEAAEAIGERGGRVFVFHAPDELAWRLQPAG